MHLQTSISREDFITAFRAVWNARGLTDYGPKQDEQWSQIYEKAITQTGWKFIDWELGGGKSTAAAIISVLDDRPMAIFVRTKYDADSLVAQCDEIKTILKHAGFKVDPYRDIRALNSDSRDWADRRNAAKEADVLVLTHASLVLSLRDKSKRIYNDFQLEDRYVIIDEKVSFVSVFEADDCQFRTLYDLLSDEGMVDLSPNPEQYRQELELLQDLCETVESHDPNKLLRFDPGQMGDFPNALLELVESPFWAEHVGAKSASRATDNDLVVKRHGLTLETANAVIVNQSVILQDFRMNKALGRKANKVTELDLFVPAHFRQALVLDATARVDGEYRDGAFPVGGQIVDLFSEEHGQLSRLRNYDGVEVNYLTGAANSISAMKRDSNLDFWVEQIENHFSKHRKTLVLCTSKVWDKLSARMWKKGWRKTNPNTKRTHEGRIFSACGSVCIAAYARDGRGSNDFKDADNVLLLGMPNLPNWLLQQEAILRVPELDVTDDWLQSEKFTHAWKSTQRNLLCSDLLQGAARSAMRVGKPVKIWVLGGNQGYSQSFLPVLKDHVAREWPGAVVTNMDFQTVAKTWGGQPDEQKPVVRTAQFRRTYGQFVEYLDSLGSEAVLTTREIAEGAGWDSKQAKSRLRDLKTNAIWKHEFGDYLLESQGRGRGARWYFKKAG